MDLVPTRRNLALVLLSSRKFEVNQILISDKQGRLRGRVWFAANVELASSMKQWKLMLNTWENITQEEEVGDEEKGPWTELWGTPGLTGEGWDMKEWIRKN